MTANCARACRPPPDRRPFGMTLIEVMVALAAGAFLVIGAVTVFVQSRATFRVIDSVARLQENARFVFDALEPDIRLASYWGLTAHAGKVQGRASPGDPAAFAIAGDCGRNWSVHLDRPVDGTNNAYTWACTAYGGAAQPDTDTLVVRRASEQPEPAAVGRLSVQSARFPASRLFVGATTPPGYPAAAFRIHRLVVNGYYVSPTSTLSTAGHRVPSLRRKTLGSGPAVTDEEVLPGVEDMQVQFGIGTGAPGAGGPRVVARWVNPGDALLDPAAHPEVQVVAVRLWLRLRAEHPETGFRDTEARQYADREVVAPNDGYRRIVVSRTIWLRNARPPS